MNFNNIKKELKDILEIILITYNRKEELQRTLKELFADHSPVRECSFTILDNASTDGATEICQGYQKKFRNLRYIRHKKNIGGNANLCRAYEMAQMKYIWVLADDDYYDWSNWQEIEASLYNDFDCIFTSLTNLSRNNGIGGILMESSFSPGAIYKTDTITSDVVQGMYANVHNFLPHLTISLAIFKNKGSFYIPKKEIVLQPPKHEAIPEYSSANNLKGIKINYSAFTQDQFWEAGMISMLSVLEPIEQYNVYKDITSLYGGPEAYIQFLIMNYKSKNFSTRNLFNIYWGLPGNYKEIFIKNIFAIINMTPPLEAPLSLDEWNLLRADSIIQRKSKQVIEKIRKMIRKVLLKLLQYT